MLKDEIEKKINRKWSNIKQRAIERIRTKFDIKIKWNQIMRDEIEKKKQLK